MLLHFLSLFVYLFATAPAKSDGELILSASIGGNTLTLNRPYPLVSGNDSVTVETVKFYISDISFYLNSKQVGSCPASYYLVDLSDTASLKIPFSYHKTFNAIAFSVGVDSLTNMAGASGGALDPMHGMYWTWQSGYINLKLEGFSTSVQANDHVFQYHIGGFQSPYPTHRTLFLPCDVSGQVHLDLQLDSLLQQEMLTQTPVIMQPGEPASNFASLVATAFRIWE